MQSVRNENNGNALFRHGTDGVEQSFRLFLRQYGGRFIENEQLELILAELTRDLGKLLVADRHIADAHTLVDMKAHLVDGRLGTSGDLVVIKRIQSFTEGVTLELGETVIHPGESAKLKVVAERKILKGVVEQPRVLLITNDPKASKVIIDINVK